MLVSLVGLFLATTSSTQPAIGGLPRCRNSSAPIQELCAVPSDVSAITASGMLGKEDIVWSRSGDRLTIIGRRDPTGETQICCAIQAALQPIGDSGLAALSVRVPRVDEALIDIMLLSAEEFSPKVFRGPKAPQSPQRVSSLKGQLHVTKLASSSLGEDRNVSIYIPPAINPGSQVPVIYLADGQVTSEYAKILEAVIMSGRVRPTMIVGIHNSSGTIEGCDRQHCDRRNFEYIPPEDDHDQRQSLFRKHLRFVTRELIPFVERTYPASARREDRVVAGSSSGAVWAFSAAALEPRLFGNILAMSPGSRPTVYLASRLQEARIYAGAGLYEAGFLSSTRQRACLAARAGAEVYFREVASGHSYMMWEILFDDGVQWLLKPSGGNSQLTPAPAPSRASTDGSCVEGTSRDLP